MADSSQSGKPVPGAAMGADEGSAMPATAPKEDPVSQPRPLLPAFVLQGIDAPFKDALAKAGFELAAFDLESLRSRLALPAGRAGQSATPLAVIWAAPARECAAALLHGADPGGFLAQWRREVEQLLGLFKRHRRALVLIEAACLTDPDAGEQHRMIRERLDRPDLTLPLAPGPMEAPKTGAGAGATDSPDAEALLTHLSRLVLHHDPGFPELLAELDAASISALAGDRPGIVSASQIMAAVASWRAGLHRADQCEAQVEVQQARAQTLNAMLDAQRQDLGALKAERELLQRQVELQLEAMKAQATEREGQPAEAHPEFRQLARRFAEQERELAAARAAAEETQSASAKAAAALPWTGMDLIETVALGPGTTRSDGIIRLSAESIRAHALFGPYLRLPAGTYEACIALRLKPRGLGRPAAVLELAWNVDEILGSHRIEGARLQTQSFVLRETFAISPEQAAQDGQGLEIRLWTDMIAAGEVSVVCIREM